MGLQPLSAPNGRLENAPLANVLAWARDARVTGCVTIRAGGGINRLYLSEGRPAGTVLSAGYRPLPQLLLELGWLDELALDRALEEVYGGVPLEQALIKTGALAEDKLAEALALQEGRNLEALGALTDGEVEFKSEPLPPGTKVLLSPERALLDALALPSGQARALELLRSLDGRAARLSSTFDGAATALRLREDERRAIELLRAGKGPVEFELECGLGQEKARALLAVLVELGLAAAVDLEAEAEARKAQAESERREAEALLAAKEMELLEREQALLVARAADALGELEGERLAQEAVEAERRIERDLWRARAHVVSSQEEPAESAARWVAEFDASQKQLDGVVAEESVRIEEVERRAAEAEAQRLSEAAEIRRLEEQARRIVAEKRAEAERLEAEARAREEAERLEAEARAREEAARLEAEARAREEAERLEAEARAREEAERLEAEARAREEAERLAAEARARAEEEARQQDLARAEEEQRQREIAALEEQARHIRAKTGGSPATADAGEAVATQQFEALTPYEVDRQEMLQARARVEKQLAATRVEAGRRARLERERESPARPTTAPTARPTTAPTARPTTAPTARPESKPVRPPTLSPEEAQREIQRRFEEQARAWLREEQNQESTVEAEPPSSLEESLQRQLQGGLTSDLESLLTNSLKPPARPGARVPTANPARPASAPLLSPSDARPVSMPMLSATDARPITASAPNPPTLKPTAPVKPPSVSKLVAKPPSGSRDALEFTFDSFSSGGSPDVADVESIWDDPAGEEDMDDETRARRARLRRMGMQNTGLLPGSDPAAAPPRAAASAQAQPAPGPQRPKSLPSAPAPGSEEAKLGQEIEQRYARIKTEDHFARLGVAKSANPQQVKAAFVALAQRFHPDKLPPSLGGIADKAREVYASIREAHDVLQNDKARTEYLATLSRPPTPMAQKGAPRQVSGEAQLEARKLRTLADLALKKKSFGEAEGHYAKAYAIEHAANDLAAQAWCIYLDPARKKDAGQVERMLKQAFAQEAGCERAHYVSGVIARANNDMDKAEMHFRSALKANPNHQDAALELRVLERRKGKTGENPPAKKKGFFGL